MVSKWEIYFCDLNPTQGSEQQGMRPVLVISNDAVNHILPVSTVLPLSSVKPGDKTYPTEVMLPAAKTGLSKDSIAMVQQVQTIAHTRLLDKSGELNDAVLQEQIRETLRQYFEI